MEIKQRPVFPGQPDAVPPAYFASLALENVKSFKERTILNFRNDSGNIAQWTIILGENGSGKTTILQAIAGLCARASSLETDKAGNKARIPVLSQVMADTSWFGWHMAGQRQNKLGTHRFEAEIQINSTIDKQESSNLQTKLIEWYFNITFKGKDRSTLTVESPAISPNLLSGLQCYAYGSGRRMAITSRAAESQLPTDSIYSLFTEDYPLRNAEEWLLELDHAHQLDRGRTSKAAARYKSVKELLIRVLPNVSDIKVQISSTGGDGSVRAEFKTPFGNVTIDQLSHGYQTVIAWVVDLTRNMYNRYPESKNPIEEPAIVLIDELDLHLHPKWQRDVMEYLSGKFKNTQFIVTAHSPLMVQACPDANIILITQEGDHSIADQQLQAIKNWRVDQILTSDLFGLKSSRPETVESLLKERDEILKKPKLSAQDKNLIKEINSKLHKLPTAETKELMEIEEFLKGVVRELKTKQK